MASNSGAEAIEDFFDCKNVLTLLNGDIKLIHSWKYPGLEDKLFLQVTENSEYLSEVGDDLHLLAGVEKLLTHNDVEELVSWLQGWLAQSVDSWVASECWD